MMLPGIKKNTLQKIIFAIMNPVFSFRYFQFKLLDLFQYKVYVGTDSNRSESDNGRYVSFVQSAVQKYSVFAKFRRNRYYREILEHVSMEDGLRYLEKVKLDSPKFLDKIIKFKENDQIGSPITYSYDEFGLISPTTLRYIKVASDLSILFGKNIGNKIAEIGVGYGGQLLVNDRIFKFKEYDLFDLDPVLNLTSKYLECYILNSSYRTLTINKSVGDKRYDLVISNYAFSELPTQLQMKYIEKVLSKSKRGYLTMNSGLKDSVFKDNKLSLDELKKLLPTFEIFSESPLTAPNNYIIVWGHKAGI
jgi:putative sugar O-methyltransferase